MAREGNEMFKQMFNANTVGLSLAVFYQGSQPYIILDVI